MTDKLTAFVDILLSTYNGEKYLQEQIDSIINQTHTNWRLLIRDDGSEDRTLEIIKDYCIRHSDKIELLEDKKGNIGYANSYLKLLHYVKADYIMFCDQDDFWVPTKIEIQIKSIINEEHKVGNKNKPCLVCSDLSICNEDLTVKIPSFIEYINYKPHLGQQITLLAPNIHGCAFIFNRALLEKCLKISNPLRGHDDWVSVVCAVIGKICFINEALVLHRIHQNNAAGFAELNRKTFLVNLKIFLKYFINNKAYRMQLYHERIKSIIQLLYSLNQISPQKIQKKYKFFIEIEKSNYFKRKFYNIFHPYIHYINWFDRLIYVFCF